MSTQRDDSPKVPKSPSHRVAWVSFSLSLIVTTGVAVVASWHDHPHTEALPPPPAVAR